MLNVEIANIETFANAKHDEMSERIPISEKSSGPTTLIAFHGPCDFMLLILGFVSATREISSAVMESE